MAKEEIDNLDEVLKGMTPEEQYELQQYLLGGITSPSQQEVHNVHKFLNDIIKSTDTTKTGYLTDEELGMTRIPVRSIKEIALFCDNVWKNKVFADYFKNLSEIVTATSLSKDAKLINLAVISRRELGDLSKKPRKRNKGWFGKKDKAEEE